MTFTVVYDANVLYPNTLRNLLIRIAQSGLVQAKWTNEILDEMVTAIGRNRPDIPSDVDDHIVTAIPGGGWMGEFPHADGITWHEPVIGWGVLDLGIGDSFFVNDDQGYFEHCPTADLVRVWHPNATGLTAPPPGTNA
ncbi:hypothetical protein [Frankia sp. CcWB2]